MISADHARDAFEHLQALGADVSLDIAHDVGHEPHPALVAQAIDRWVWYAGWSDKYAQVLGGLNEGTWPAEAATDPWLNRPMREALGLPYRLFGFDSAMSEVVDYAREANEWMKAGGRDTVAARLGLAPAATAA